MGRSNLQKMDASWGHEPSRTAAVSRSAGPAAARPWSGGTSGAGPNPPDPAGASQTTPPPPGVAHVLRLVDDPAAVRKRRNLARFMGSCPVRRHAHDP